MAKRRFDYTITGSITIEEADLRAAFLARPFEFETEDPTPEQLTEESMELLTHAQLAEPERLLRSLLFGAAVELRLKIRPGDHSIPDVSVVAQGDVA